MVLRTKLHLSFFIVLSFLCCCILPPFVWTSYVNLLLYPDNFIFSAHAPILEGHSLLLKTLKALAVRGSWWWPDTSFSRAVIFKECLEVLTLNNDSAISTTDIKKHKSVFKLSGRKSIWYWGFWKLAGLNFEQTNFICLFLLIYICFYFNALCYCI